MNELIEPEKYGIKTQYEALMFMKNLGFKVNENTKIVKNTDEIIGFIDDLATRRNTLAYDIDGVVIKVNELDLYTTIVLITQHSHCFVYLVLLLF